MGRSAGSRKTDRPSAAGVDEVAQRMYPLRIAVATRWARSPLPSLRAMRARWDLMVSAESPSCSPTCRFDSVGDHPQDLEFAIT